MNHTAKIQRSKVGEPGLLTNQLMANNSSEPVVGKGATILHYSDRTCAEVIEVSPDGKTVKLETLQAQWDRTKPGGQGHQNWILKPTGQFITVRYMRGAWRQKVQEVVFTDEYAKTIGPKFFESEDYKKVYVDGELIVVPGITRLKTEYHRVRILFGVKDYHYDWEF